jgi:anti-sigma regulatory factor (Ser/Thr protein kinase)
MNRDASPAQLVIPIREESDVFAARGCARALAFEEGFREGGAAAIVTAVSEVARNIVLHAGTGEILVEATSERGRRGVRVVARDRAPGIPDVEAAMQDGFSTADGLGLGLSGARRLMDEFQIVSSAGEGTTVIMKKWAHERHR